VGASVIGARGKLSGFSTGAAACCRGRTRVSTGVLFFTFSAVIECFLGCFPLFCEIGRLPPKKSEIGQLRDRTSPTQKSEIGQLSDLRFLCERRPISQRTGQIGCKDPGNAKINLVRSWKKKLKLCPTSKKNTKKVKKMDNNHRASGPTPVARGGSGAKSTPLAARPTRGVLEKIRGQLEASFLIIPTLSSIK